MQALKKYNGLIIEFNSEDNLIIITGSDPAGKIELEPLITFMNDFNIPFKNASIMRDDDKDGIVTVFIDYENE